MYTRNVFSQHGSAYIPRCEKTLFVYNSHEFEEHKGFSSEQYVVSYKSVSGLANQSGLCYIAAAQYCTDKCYGMMERLLLLST